MRKQHMEEQAKAFSVFREDTRNSFYSVLQTETLASSAVPCSLPREPWSLTLQDPWPN